MPEEEHRALTDSVDVRPCSGKTMERLGACEKSDLIAVTGNVTSAPTTPRRDARSAARSRPTTSATSIDGAEVRYVHVEQGVHRVNGVDVLADIRNLLR